MEKKINKEKPDIFGLAALDYLAGIKEAKIMVEINIAGTESLPVSYLFRTYSSMPTLEKKALDLCKGKILDVGAGTGSHALWLQKKGFEVHAIDQSEVMAGIMHKKGVKNVHNRDFTKHTQNGFDTILLLMNGVGLAGTMKNLKPFLSHAKSLLNPGGQVLLESTNILYVYQYEDGSYRVPFSDKYYGEVEMVAKYNDLSSQPFKWLYVDYDTLTFETKKIGFDTKLITMGRNHNYLASLTYN